MRNGELQLRFLLLSLLLASVSEAKIPTKIDAVLIHPLFDKYYLCAEHTGSQDWGAGDSLGADCIIHKFKDENGRKWMRSFKNSGSQNKDWYGWRQNVLAPISGKAVKVHINDTVNRPGKSGKGLATLVILSRADGVNVTIAHLRELTVKKGDLVKAGQKIGLVGNNGKSMHPHIHVGAWKDKTPLQVRFDQHKIRMEY